MKRKNIMVLMISLSLVLLLDSSYALLRSTQVGKNPYVINAGNLQVTFVDSETEFLNLTNMYPMSDKEGSSQDKELSFMVQNTGNVDSYYDITLEETSTNPEFKSVIRYIINKDDKGYNEPKTLGEDKFIEVGGYLKPNESSSYKVKVWLDYDADNTYMNKEFKAKVVVNSFQESNYAKDVIKSKLVKYEESSKDDFTGGLVAVNTNGDLYNETIETQEIREYRYSGPTVNNYVIFNDEIWRIMGVFKDENNQEHVKIIRNDILKSVYPDSYIINDFTYVIKGNNFNIWAYYNYNQTIGQYNSSNDWTTAGLQYFLNTENDGHEHDGYLSYLKNDSLSMIENSKYYLGTVTFKRDSNLITSGGIDNTPQESYMNERAIEGCEGGIGSTENTGWNLTFESIPNCRVWKGNTTIWKGKIALMYPSDYGFSVSSKNWNTKLITFDIIKKDSWMNVETTDRSLSSEFLLTSASNEFVSTTYLDISGIVNTVYVRNDAAVRPTLYLKSNVKITLGDGIQNNQYILSVE